MRANSDRTNAARRVGVKIAFYFHCASYVMVNILLFTVNMVSGERLWFFYPLLGWLSGLLIHAFITYSKWPSAFRRRMLQKEMKLIKQTNRKR